MREGRWSYVRSHKPKEAVRISIPLPIILSGGIAMKVVRLLFSRVFLLLDRFFIGGPNLPFGKEEQEYHSDFCGYAVWLSSMKHYG